MCLLGCVLCQGFIVCLVVNVAPNTINFNAIAIMNKMDICIQMVIYKRHCIPLEYSEIYMASIHISSETLLPTLTKTV